MIHSGDLVEILNITPNQARDILCSQNSGSFDPMVVLGMKFYAEVDDGWISLKGYDEWGKWGNHWSENQLLVIKSDHPKVTIKKIKPVHIPTNQLVRKYP